MSLSESHGSHGYINPTPVTSAGVRVFNSSHSDEAAGLLLWSAEAEGHCQRAMQPTEIGLLGEKKDEINSPNGHLSSLTIALEVRLDK